MTNPNPVIGATGLQTRRFSAAKQESKAHGREGEAPAEPHCRADSLSIRPTPNPTPSKPKHPWHRSLHFTLMAIGVTLLTAVPANAIGLGLRGGASFDPDQFVLGGQVMLFHVFPMIELAPGVDVGFGSNISTTIVNVDFRFNLPALPKVSPNIYVGAGPAWVSAEPEGGKRNAEVAASIFAGLRIPFSPISSYNLEARFGLGDYPDMKFMAGVLFGL